ncbi:MAG: acetyl-CoA carboxylase carboxyltransferase subunit alpha, partial [Terriglobia bacterium]
MADQPYESLEARQLEQQIAELQETADSAASREEIERLQAQLQSLRRKPSSHNDAWNRVLLARHPQRPYTLDYIDMLFTGFTELHGDRRFGDDPAIAGGLAHFEGK